MRYVTQVLLVVATLVSVTTIRAEEHEAPESGAIDNFMKSLSSSQLKLLRNAQDEAFFKREPCEGDSGLCNGKNTGQYCPSYEDAEGKCVKDSDGTCHCDPNKLQK